MVTCMKVISGAGSGRPSPESLFLRHPPPEEGVGATVNANCPTQASYEATFAHNFWKQMLSRVPAIPARTELTGKTVLVTGANVGLGFEAVRNFLRLWPSLVIMGVRSVDKGEAAAAALRREFLDARIEVWELDMESFRSVQAFAARAERELDRLHVAVFNAGLGKLKFERVDEGGCHEVTIQLRPTTSLSEPGRLSIVNSGASLGLSLEDPGDGRLFDSFDRPEKFDGFGQYGLSKLLVMIFVAKLAQKIDPKEVIVNCTDPGATKGTSFFRNVNWIMSIVLRAFLGLIGRLTVDASRIYLHSTLALGEESHGSWTDWIIRAWPKTMYTDEGHQMGERLWDETLEELKFAGVKEKL
ncbi:NAD(P)-binding protein [Bimuria novae-zelandiae CBS 107.79]|uniref:NAD(P)-binding protein n=1 Tax=Bimuria novae-zelandiae CBS 107.79 TaxID=1447943 RepID=A0A6A5V276_9PLEO|nr:NAD(P)-binding protein [Bimuria novae-zelandiae CBS 107.79]